MPLTDTIIAKARDEMPLDFDAIVEKVSGGQDLVERRAQSIMIKLFGAELDGTAQAALDPLVSDYAGKTLALALINAARSYWSKQAVSIGATGRNENKTFSDRAIYLRELRQNLIEETRSLFPDVELLLPNYRGSRVANVPRTQQAIGVATPDPFAFEPPYGS